MLHQHIVAIEYVFICIKDYFIQIDKPFNDENLVTSLL